MLSRVIGLGGVALVLAWFQFFAGGNPSYWFFIIPVFFLFLLYFGIVQDLPFFWWAVILFLIAVTYGTIAKQGLSYVTLPALGMLISFVLLGVVFLYVRSWHRRILDLEESKRLVKGEVRNLQSRYMERIDSLGHLERQVSGLVHLFEMARNFNECLEFAEIIEVLDRKIASELGFDRGTLVLIEPLDQSPERVGRLRSFGPLKREDDEANRAFASECLKRLVSLNQVVKLAGTEPAERLEGAAPDVRYPLWVFPLVVEHHVIALLAVEGSVEHDFPKFEVLVSQLVLQVKKVRLYERVKELSIVDGLTQAFVRRHFLERFREELGRAARYEFPLSVLMVDVDHFKRYNDDFGHLSGDHTLREVAQVVREHVRRVDVIGRFGGEEFIVVAPEIGKQKGIELAERIRSAVARKRFNFYGEETQVTVSIGASSFPEDLGPHQRDHGIDACVSGLIDKADQALYRAKEEGRNRVVAYGL